MVIGGLADALNEGLRRDHEEPLLFFQNPTDPVPPEVLPRDGLSEEVRRHSRGDPRAARAVLVWPAVATRRRDLVLTDNSEIGTTTASPTSLQQECHGEGSLLLNANLRTVVATQHLAASYRQFFFRRTASPAQRSPRRSDGRT